MLSILVWIPCRRSEAYFSRNILSSSFYHWSYKSLLCLRNLRSAVIWRASNSHRHSFYDRKFRIKYSVEWMCVLVCLLDVSAIEYICVNANISSHFHPHHVHLLWDVVKSRTQRWNPPNWTVSRRTNARNTERYHLKSERELIVFIMEVALLIHIVASHLTS